jgi:hypothetical protein
MTLYSAFVYNRGGENERKREREREREKEKAYLFLEREKKMKPYVSLVGYTIVPFQNTWSHHLNFSFAAKFFFQNFGIVFEDKEGGKSAPNFSGDRRCKMMTVNS